MIVAAMGAPRPAIGLCMGAQSTTGCMTTRSVGTIETIECHQMVTFHLPFVTCPSLALV